MQREMKWEKAANAAQLLNHNGEFRFIGGVWWLLLYWQTLKIPNEKLFLGGPREKTV